MGTRTVRLDEEVYERIKAHKREDETFSETIDRLTGGYSLLDFAGDYDEADAERHRDLLDRADRVAAEDRRETLDRLDG